jgi:serine O-acetyltransferase
MSNKSALCQLRSPQEVWEAIRREAQELSQIDPLLHATVHARILVHEDFASALSQTLALHIGDQNLSPIQLQGLFSEVYAQNDQILLDAIFDMVATVDRDPACTHLLEPFLFRKGWQALQVHRIAHHLWNQQRTFLAQLLQSTSSRVFGVDIHPGAKIGHGILVDHATGLVVGETATIGDDVSILHGVTLGGTGKETGDRHPKVENGVLLSAHAQLLGNIRIGRGSKVGAGAVVLRDVPSHVTVAGVPAKQVGIPDCEAPALNMEAYFPEL